MFRHPNATQTKHGGCDVPLLGHNTFVNLFLLFYLLGLFCLFFLTQHRIYRSFMVIPAASFLDFSCPWGVPNTFYVRYSCSKYSLRSMSPGPNIFCTSWKDISGQVFPTWDYVEYNMMQWRNVHNGRTDTKNTSFSSAWSCFPIARSLLAPPFFCATQNLKASSKVSVLSSDMPAILAGGWFWRLERILCRTNVPGWPCCSWPTPDEFANWVFIPAKFGWFNNMLKNAGLLAFSAINLRTLRINVLCPI